MERKDIAAVRYVFSPLFEKLFPAILWRTQSPAVYLTYDDGPHPEVTPNLVEILKEYSVRASFFLLGSKAVQFPDHVRLLTSSGQMIGNHTFSHPNLLFRSGRYQESEILRTNQSLTEIIGTPPKLFRPPYGFFNFATLSVTKKLNMKTVLFNMDSGDYGSSSALEVSSYILKKVRPGNIIVLHDNEATKKKASDLLRRILDGLLKLSLTVEPLPDAF
jgi:peptidoglycan/xylan/chitin deacetylase (PgdA/CDA1 family)